MLRNQVSPVQLIFTDNPFLLFKSQGNPLGPAKVVVMMYFFEFLLSSSFGSKMIKDSYASELGISRQILVDTCKILVGGNFSCSLMNFQNFPFHQLSHKFTNYRFGTISFTPRRYAMRYRSMSCKKHQLPFICLFQQLNSLRSLGAWVGFWLHKQLYHNCLRTPTWKLLRRGIFFVTFILFNFCNFLLS